MGYIRHIKQWYIPSLSRLSPSPALILTLAGHAVELDTITVEIHDPASAFNIVDVPRALIPKLRQVLTNLCGERPRRLSAYGARQIGLAL